MRRTIKIVIFALFALLLTGCNQAKSIDNTGKPDPSQTTGKLDTSSNDAGGGGETLSAGAGLVGLVRLPAGQWPDDWGLVLGARDISPLGMTLEIEHYDPERTEDELGLIYGTEFRLQRLENGEWVDLQPIVDELAWPDIARVIKANEINRDTASWEQIYGALPEGAYRLCKELLKSEGEESLRRTYYVPFDIMEVHAGTPIVYKAGGVGISVPYTVGWEYAITEYTPDCDSWGINFRPVGKDGWVELHYHEFFGVCGTGLESREIRLQNGMTGHMGTYDGHEAWNFISFPAGDNHLVALNYGADAWLAEYNGQVMDTLDRMLMSWTEK